MTKEQFEKAKELEERIKSLDKLIDQLTTHTYEQEPPTRRTGWALCRNSDIETVLNEGEVVTIIEALQNKKIQLQDEFMYL